MPLTQEEINELNEYFTLTSEVQNIDMEKLIGKFNDAFDQLSELPSLKSKPRKVIIKRTRSAMNSAFSNQVQDGDGFVFIPFGPLGSATDWNKELFQHIKTESERGNIKGLAKEGRIMTMNEEYEVELPDGTKVKKYRDVPVSKIYDYAFVERYLDKADGSIHEKNDSDGLVPVKEFVVVRGEPWKKGQGDLIPRDHRTMLKTSENYGWSKVLIHNFQMNVVGIACPKDTVADREKADWRLLDLTIRGNQADNKNKEFFFKNFEPFQCYTGNFKVDEKKCTGWRYILSVKKQVVATAFDNPFKDLDGNERQIDDVIEELFGTLKDMFQEDVVQVKIGKGTDQLPDFLDGFRELRQYHEGKEGDTHANSFSGQAVKDEKGVIQKTASKWDKKVWNKYMIMRVDVTEIIEPTKEGGNYRYKISDSTVPYPMTVWASDLVFNQPSPIPSTCLIMAQTSRRPDRWDPVTRERVPDPENGELSLNMITIGVIPEMDDIELPEIDLL